MSDKHSLILEFLGLSPEDWQDSRVEEHFAKEYGELAELLDQHAAEQREACVMSVRNGRLEYWSKYYASPPESFIDERIRNARVEKIDACSR